MSNGKKIRPLQGEVLLYMESAKAVSDGGVMIPEKHQERPQFGEVRRLGIWPQNKRGWLIPFPVAPGDRVLVRPASGRWLHSDKERLKLVNATDIIAIVEAKKD